MSVSLLTPDLRRLLKELDRRLGILERRVMPAAPAAERHTHNGTGGASTVVTAAGPIPAEASDSFAVAMGDEAAASAASATAVGKSAAATGIDSTAVGVGTLASGVDSTAVGPDATASGQDSMAVGHGAVAAHTKGVAIGYAAVTTNTQQIVLGGHDNDAPNVIIGIRDAFSSGQLNNRQMAFYADETFDILVITVKYSTGTVKTVTLNLV